MIKALLKNGFQRFGRRYNYDTDYMSHVTEISTSAGMRLAMLPLASQFRGPKGATGLWAGALLGSALEGDCGPCAQLVIDMAIEAGVSAEQLGLCISGSTGDAGEVGLGFRFSQAAISGTVELEGLREEIENRFGREAIVAASFAASSGRVYPVLKRGLGYGHACSKLRVGNRQVGYSAQDG